MDKKSILAMIFIALIILLLPFYQKLINDDKYIKTTNIIDSSLKTIDSDVKKIAINPETVTERENSLITAMKTETFAYVEEDGFERTLVIESEKISVEISNKGGGSLKKVILKKYSKYDKSLVNMIDEQLNNDLKLQFQDLKGELIETDNFLFHSNTRITNKVLNNNETFTISYFLTLNSNEISKTYIFYGDKYHFDVVIKFSNPEQSILNRQYQFGWKNGLPSTESYVADDYTYNQAYAYMGDELESFSISDEKIIDPVSLSGSASWLAIRTKYFIMSISNINANARDGIYYSAKGVQKSNYIQRIYNIGYNIRYINEVIGDTLRVYMGPLDHKELGKYGNKLDILIMNNGWYERVFRFFSLLILPILEFLYKVIPNYGLVIIIFSLLVKIVLHPLTKKSYTSMKEMQKIQPIMSELNEKFKNDPQRKNKELMKLYKEHGVNPFGGCLPIILQMPLLIALFIVFRSTIQLRGASFIPGWIDDLSRTDTLFMLPFNLPMYGNEFNLLPLLMMITMIFQSKISMHDPKQKAMVYIMPIFMLLIFNSFPSGLNLYYTMFNLWSIIQQALINNDISLMKLIRRKEK